MSPYIPVVVILYLLGGVLVAWAACARLRANRAEVEWAALTSVVDEARADFTPTVHIVRVVVDPTPLFDVIAARMAADLDREWAEFNRT